MKNNFLKRIKTEQTIIYILLFLTGILYYVPRFLMEGIPHYLNEDTYFHLNRVIGLRNVFHSPINYLNFAHNGPMVNIFYPWLTMYPMYLLYRLCGSYVLGYKLFYMSLSVLTIFIAYFVMDRISKNKVSSFIFAIIYTFSAYRFINLFRRAHLGESISMTALLFVLLGLYNISFGDHKSWGSLTVGMALIAYSHNLFLVTTSGIIIFFLLISFWFWNDKTPRLISFAKAAFTAIAFSAASFIPILQYMKTNQLYTPGGSGEGLQDTAYPIWTIIDKSIRNQPVSYAPGFLVAAALVSLIMFYLTNLLKKGTSERNSGIDCFAAAGMIIFLSASNLLPWKFIGDHTPLYIIQFVWRLNAHSTIFILAAFSFYLPRFLRTKKIEAMVSALIILLSLFLHFSAILTLHKEENTRIFEAEISSGDAITFDYAALQAKEYRNLHGYAMDDVLLEGIPVGTDISYSKDGTTYTALINTPSDGKSLLLVDIPVFRYANQICMLNGEPTNTVMSERGGIMLKIPSGEMNQITISCRHTGLTYFSWIFSLAAGILFLCFHIFKPGNNSRKNPFAAVDL